MKPQRENCIAVNKAGIMGDQKSHSRKLSNIRRRTSGFGVFVGLALAYYVLFVPFRSGIVYSVTLTDAIM